MLTRLYHVRPEMLSRRTTSLASMSKTDGSSAGGTSGSLGFGSAMPRVYDFCGASCCSKSLVLSLVAASLAWVSSA